jgi:hypothetical protein
MSTKPDQAQPPMATAYDSAMRLTLRPVIALPEPFAKYGPLTYEVDGLPPNRMIRIHRRMVPIEPACWSILPTTLFDNGLGVKGPGTGEYASPEEALATIDEAFLHDPTYWREFGLVWHLPLEPGLLTHATLVDLRTARGAQPIADSEGADEIETLLNLWTRLTDTNAPEDAIACAASAYQRRTGKQPERKGSVSE